MNSEQEAIDVLDASLETLVGDLAAGMGLNEGAYGRACDALRYLARAWQGRDVVPRRAVALVLDVVTVIFNAIADWKEEHKVPVVKKACELDELIGACFIDETHA